MNNPHPHPPGGAPPAVQHLRGRFFQFAIPAGWEVREEGPYAVVLAPRDNNAITIMVGNAGLPRGANPLQYLHERLAALGHADLRPSAPVQAQPVAGYSSGVQVSYVYSCNAMRCQGVALCSIRQGYDTCDMVMTAAAAIEQQWHFYASWLPHLATQFAPLSSDAFGAGGIARQNLQNSIIEGQQNAAYRAWSADTWNQVVADRNISNDRNQFDFRQNLGNVTRYANPYDSRPIDLPSNNAIYWVNTLTGQIVGSENSAYDPRSATDPNWRPMPPEPPRSR